MGNRKGTHCDKLVTTVCMLCILCAPHSHCSVHDHQLPRTLFHHHGRAKMSRPPDATVSLVHLGNEPTEVWKSRNVDSQPFTKSSVNPTNYSPSYSSLEVVAGVRSSEDSPSNDFESRLSVPYKRSASSSVGLNHASVVTHPSGSNAHNGGRLRRSGDHLPPPSSPDSSVESSPFLEEIFKEFGDGKVITVEGFKKMLSVIGARKPSPDGMINADSRKVAFGAEAAAQEGLISEKSAAVYPCPHNGLKDGRVTFKLPRNLSVPQNVLNSNSRFSSYQWHCLTAPEILSVADIGGAGGNGEVNRTQFVHRLCPALVYGTLGTTLSLIQDPQPSPSLTQQKDHHSHEHPKDGEIDSTLLALPSSDPKVWLYASLSVIVISLCGLLGVAVIPVMQQVFYHQLLQFLVALAVGTLCGDALLHLLPHAMAPLEHDHNHHDLPSEATDELDHHDVNMWKGLGAMLGLVFFFTTEKCLTLVGDWRKRRQRLKKPVPSRVRVMREAGPSSAVESGVAGQVLNSGADVLLGASACGSSSPRIGLTPGSHSVGEKLCKHKYSSYPYCYGEITTGEIVNESSSVATAEEKPSNQDKKSRQRRRQNGCSESIGESGDDKLEKLMVRDGSSGFVKSPIEAIGRGYLESHQKDGGEEEKKEEEEDEEGGDGGNSYTVILREHERPHHGHSHAHGHVHSAPESISSVAWMVVMGDGLHNLTDGMAIGAAFAAGIAGGFSTAVAVFCHELPHELGDFAVLLKAGMTAKQAVFYNMFSSLLCYFGMILGIFIGDTESATQWIFAAAAGMFLYIALVDMIPELTTSHSKEGGSFFQSALQLLGLICGVGVMLLIALYEHDLKDIFRGEDVNPNSKHPH